ncbi:MAG: TraR/DksA C4-type zinc finger protein [Actinomycetota bacterium]|jgi:DnaK suppressor protein|nr:TraR/DksA C4-type zinc finger protein [Actinomycetota bacterium]
MAKSNLDKEFIESQKARLEELKGELKRMIEGLEEDEEDRGEEEGDSQFDSGDMSQAQFTREMDATVGERSEKRLEDVERALEKIEDGTYGICDDTGEEIPKGRLEAMPEAVVTVEAQERRGR